MMLDRVRKLLPDMPPNFRKIASYILDHEQNVAFSSIYDISKAIGVSNASLVRFAKSLGEDGYQSFKREIQDDIKHRLSPYEKITFTNLDTFPREKQRQKFCDNEVSNLRRTLDKLDVNTLDRLVAAMKSARRIFVAGFGLSRYFIGSFKYSLLATLDKDIIEITGSVSDYAPDLKSFKSADCLVFMTFPPYSAEGEHLASLVKERGGTFILFTDSAACPVYSYADIVVRCENNSLLLHNSYVGGLAVLQILANMLSLEGKSASAEGRREVNAIQAEGYKAIGAQRPE